jgi:hypothetical protein|tara:strand:- start:32 stop:253 length:222 start_codon:yes stop_codon:yes gene_type:complete
VDVFEILEKTPKKTKRYNLCSVFMALYFRIFFFLYCWHTIEVSDFFADVYNSFVRVNKGLSVYGAREKRHIFA